MNRQRVTNILTFLPSAEAPKDKDKKEDDDADQLHAMRETVSFSKRLASR